MDKKRIVASAVVFLILAVLLYLQYRHWQSFDWGTFWAQTHRIKKVHVLHAIALIYIGYVMRAIRWKIFLRPVRPKATVMDMLSPTLIGFTGLALLGRAGEFIRPYLIARRTDLPFSSQLAAWAVERIFDVGAFTVLIVLAIFLPSALPAIPHPEYYRRFQEGGFFLIAVVLITTLAAIVIRRSGDAVARWVEERFGHRGNEPAFERNSVRRGELNPAEIEVVRYRRLSVVGVGIMKLVVRDHRRKEPGYDDEKECRHQRGHNPQNISDDLQNS